jgi:hypothetical protein
MIGSTQRPFWMRRPLTTCDFDPSLYIIVHEKLFYSFWAGLRIAHETEGPNQNVVSEGPKIIGPRPAGSLADRTGRKRRIFIYIFYSFCKNIQPFWNLSYLNTNRHGAWRPTVVRSMVAGPTGGTASRRGPRRLRPIRRAPRRQANRHGPTAIGSCKRCAPWRLDL